MDFALTSEQRELREMVRDFAQTEVAAAQKQMDLDHEFPYDVWRKWGDLGMAGIMIPEEHGGSGLDSLSYIVAMEEMGTVSQTFALIWQVHVLVANMYVQLGTAAQKEKWLPAFARGDKLAAIGLTEPGAGSDAGGMRTRAVRDGDRGWCINGSKIFISNAGTKISDGLVVMAVTGEKTPIEDIMEVLADPAIIYQTKVGGIGAFVSFMSRVGTLRNPPANWRDMFFPEAFAGAGG